MDAEADGNFSFPVPSEGSYSYKTKLRGTWAKADAFLEIDTKRTGSASTDSPLLVDWDATQTDADERNQQRQQRD